jgi:hypothetical protein
VTRQSPLDWCPIHACAGGFCGGPHVGHVCGDTLVSGVPPYACPLCGEQVGDPKDN